MASDPKMEYQDFLCIFQKNSAMASLGLKEMGKFFWEGREKGLLCWLSQFSKTKLRPCEKSIANFSALLKALKIKLPYSKKADGQAFRSAKVHLRIFTWSRLKTLSNTT